MSNQQQEDLDLLLSLQDRVLETPPASPSKSNPPSRGYLSDDDDCYGSPKRWRRQQDGPVDMSVFRSAVQDCLDREPQTANKPLKSNRESSSNGAEVEKFSGLRIRNQVVSPVELSNRFADIRFVRLPAIKNLLVGDTLFGCWATVGVLYEKGNPKTSSSGKPYCIWKFGCLDEYLVSVFLFGDAYERNSMEKTGTVFALFNCSVRKDNSDAGFSLSLYSAGHILKMGTSVDYGVCQGKRKDGMACTMVINKRHGIYCKYHKLKASEKYSVTRTELKGGNLRTAFRDHLKSEGIYVVEPLADRSNLTKSKPPMKLLSVDGLKKALSNAGKVTTNAHSQGIRFLTEITGKFPAKDTNKGSAIPSPSKSGMRSSSSVSLNTTAVHRTQQPNAKRIKTGQGRESTERNKQNGEKMIELDYVSSDED